MCLCVLEQRDQEDLPTFKDQNIKNFSPHFFKVTETGMWVWLQLNLLCQSCTNGNNVSSASAFLNLNLWKWLIYIIVCNQSLSVSMMLWNPQFKSWFKEIVQHFGKFTLCHNPHCHVSTVGAFSLMISACCWDPGDGDLSGSLNKMEVSIRIRNGRTPQCPRGQDVTCKTTGTDN